jgi:membrane protein YqaA with SNARE-associated domain
MMSRMTIDREKILKYAMRILFIFFIFLLSYFVFFSTPEKLVSLIGVQNSYAFLFLLAFLGGLTTFTGAPYHPTLVVLVLGGLNPLLGGVTAAVGVMLGDSTSYLVGYHGGAILPGGLQKILKRLLNYFMRYPRALPFFFFAYGAFIPFSNDFIVVTMGLARYPFWRVFIPLGLGNLVFNIGLAYLAVHAYGLLRGVLY